jgi:hypothetical protein
VPLALLAKKNHVAALGSLLHVLTPLPPLKVFSIAGFDQRSMGLMTGKTSTDVSARATS